VAVTPSVIDSFGHAYFSVSLGSGMYAASNGSLDTVTTPTRGNATRSMRCNSTPAENVEFGHAATIVAFSFYIRFEDMPTTDVLFLRYSNANGNGDFGYDESDNKFYVKAGAAAAVSGHTALQADQWYRCTVEYDTSTGTATLRASVDNGVEWSSANGQASANITLTSFGRVADVGSAETHYLNSLVISETNGDYEQLRDWRTHAVEDLHPISDGTHDIAASGDFDSDTTALDNSSTTVYTFLDNIPFTGSVSGEDNIRQDVAGATKYVEVIFEDGTAVEDPDTVRGVITMVQESGLGFALWELHMMLSDGTTEVLSGGNSMVDSSVDNPGTLAVFFRRIMDAPGGSWSHAEVQDLRYRLGYGDGAPIPHAWNAMIDVLTHQEPGGAGPLVVVTER
jgi:hypothetical protein